MSLASLDESAPRSSRGLHMWHAMENLNSKATRGPERGSTLLKQTAHTSRSTLSKLTSTEGHKAEFTENFETGGENSERLSRNIVVPFGSSTEKPLYVSHGKDGYMKEYWVNEWIGDIRRQVFKLLHKQTWHAQFTRPCDRRVVTRTFSVRSLGENAARAKAYNMMPWETGDPELRRPLGRPSKRHHFLPNDFDETTKRLKTDQAIEKSDIAAGELDEWSSCMQSFQTMPSLDTLSSAEKAIESEKNLLFPPKKRASPINSQHCAPVSEFSQNQFVDKVIHLLDGSGDGCFPAMESSNDLFGTVPYPPPLIEKPEATSFFTAPREYSSHRSPITVEDPPIYSALSSIFQPFSETVEDGFEETLPPVAVNPPTVPEADFALAYPASTPPLTQCSIAKLFCHFCNNSKNREALGAIGYKKILSILFPDPYAHKISLGPSGTTPDVETLLHQRNQLVDYLLVNRVLYRLAEKEEAQPVVVSDAPPSSRPLTLPLTQDRDHGDDTGVASIPAITSFFSSLTPVSALSATALFSSSSSSFTPVNATPVPNGPPALTSSRQDDAPPTVASSTTTASARIPIKMETQAMVSTTSSLSSKEVSCKMLPEQHSRSSFVDQKANGVSLLSHNNTTTTSSSSSEAASHLLDSVQTFDSKTDLTNNDALTPVNSSFKNGVLLKKLSTNTSKLQPNGVAKEVNAIPNDFKMIKITGDMLSSFHDDIFPSQIEKVEQDENAAITQDTSSFFEQKQQKIFCTATESSTEDTRLVSSSQHLLPLTEEANSSSIPSFEGTSFSLSSSPLPVLPTEETFSGPSSLHACNNLCSTPSTSVESPTFRSSVHTTCDDEATKISSTSAEGHEKEAPTVTSFRSSYRSVPTTIETFRVLAWLLHC